MSGAGFNRSVTGRGAIRAVLFDLDGTLADTAPDLIDAVRRLRVELDLPQIDLTSLRSLASRGALALLDAGLPELEVEQRAAFRMRYLADYRARCWELSEPFAGIESLLERLESSGLVWGVVTNKIAELAGPVLQQAGWAERCGCLVAGDDAARPKPAADPVLMACRRLDVDPSAVLFVGDDLRDIQSGRAAGCLTAAALWGYLADDDDGSAWNADLVLCSPGDLFDGLATLERRAIA